jgi:biofilm PGA synthesis N-glycosyltransferase PgaC
MFFFETAFILSAAILVYVYAGFPAILLLLTKGRRWQAPSEYSDKELPTVALIVAAYNEETVIEKKIQNGLAIDYPAEKLRFIFVSDSNDNTNEILRRYESPRVSVRILPERRGKVVALEAAYEICREEVLVMSDANTYYRPDSIRKLVRHFRNPQVGVVTGDVRILPSEETFGAGEGLYYKYERKLQELETAFWATVAIDGAMYAFRRSLLRPPSNGLIADDLVTSMNVGCQGYRIIYDPAAIAEEDPTPNSGMEFHRKVRVVAYAIQSLLAGEGVPPLREGKLLWTYVSHKVLRWLAPIFLIWMLICNLALVRESLFWRSLLCGQILFYGAAWLAWKKPELDSKLLRVPYYFSMVNLAAFFGILRGMKRKQRPVWMRTERLTPSVGD